MPLIDSEISCTVLPIMRLLAQQHVSCDLAVKQDAQTALQLPGCQGMLSHL